MSRTAISARRVGSNAIATPTAYFMAKINKFRTSGPMLPSNVTFPRERSIATIMRRLLSHAVPAQRRRTLTNPQSGRPRS